MSFSTNDMRTLKRTKAEIQREPQWWCVHLMNFVDDFRRHRRPVAMTESFEITDRRIDALLASTAESLCDEIGIEPPKWLYSVPECEEPWFVGDLERLKAISIVE